MSNTEVLDEERWWMLWARVEPVIPPPTMRQSVWWVVVVVVGASSFWEERESWVNDCDVVVGVVRVGMEWGVKPWI